MKTNKKYKLTDEYITLGDKKFYRIEALKDFYDVKKGDKGGFIESEKNLSQINDCWVYDNAKVFGNARVFGDAKVYENASISDIAEVFGVAKINGNAKVFGNANVYGDAVVSDKAQISGNAIVCKYAEIFGNAQVYGNAEIFGNALVHGNAKVFGDVKVYGNAEIFGYAVVENNSDYIVFKNWWSSGRYFTWTRSNNMWRVGCFYGTGEELIARAYNKSELLGREYERVVKYVESILKDTNKDSNTVTIVNKIKQCLTKFLEKFKL